MASTYCFSPASHVVDDDAYVAANSAEEHTSNRSEPTVETPSSEAETSTAPPQSSLLDHPFPFMNLPTELRLNIYRHALCRPKPIILSIPRKPEPEPSAAEHPLSLDGNGDQLAPRRREITLRGTRVVRAYHDAPEDVNTEPLAPALLRLNHLVYRETRPVLYGDNEFVLELDTALHTLTSLHQRSRSLIKHIRLTIPTHHDILEGFADLVRLGLRYCWGLKTLTITLPYMFPEDRSISNATNVYANAFHILRWLPKNCVVNLEGNVHEEIRRVVDENGKLAVTLDEKAYLRRQHQMPDRH